MTPPDSTGRWLPADFSYPALVRLRCGAHLRPIRADDVAIDFPAVMGSRQRLWEKYGTAWGWPPEQMTVEQDREDLARHEREIAARESFNYAVLDAEESQLFGCVYIDPPEHEGTDALVSWWVVDSMVDSDLDHELAELVPRWVTTVWPFQSPRFAP
jgi:hypothetical protein